MQKQKNQKTIQRITVDVYQTHTVHQTPHRAIRFNLHKIPVS